MTLALVLLHLELGREEEAMRELRKIPEVKKAYLTLGVYDAVVKVEAEKYERVREVVVNNIRVNLKEYIRGSLTSIVKEDF